MARPIQQQIILRALEIVSDENRWTAATLARDQHGRSCPVHAPEAVRFCAVGALARAASELLGDRANHALVAHIENTVLAADGQPRLNLAHINDQQGRKAIIELFKKALAV